MTDRYASGKLRAGLSMAGAVGALVGALFLYQQCQLWSLQSQWSKMAKPVRELEVINKQISQFRPWYDESVKGLTILRGLTQAFPEDGSVTAKTVEIRDLGAVTCSGTARNYRGPAADSAEVARDAANPRCQPGSDSGPNSSAAVQLQLRVDGRRQRWKLRTAKNCW
jgi:hypothetical protein